MSTAPPPPAMSTAPPPAGNEAAGHGGYSAWGSTGTNAWDGATAAHNTSGNGPATFAGSGNGPAGYGAGHDGSGHQATGGQSAYPPPPPAYVPPEVPPAATSAVPRPRTSENGWQTRADEGWRLATEASVPSPAGHTRSGLPKRVPQAQLVPGGVEPTSRERTRRTPEEVRGLLAAYHRGVQRGRSAGATGTPGAERPSTKETSG